MFKDVLKELRNKKGLLQDELGEIIGKSKSAIGMYETGQRMPNDKTLKKLSEYFGVTIDYLFGFEQEKLLMRKEKILLNEKEEDLIIAVRQTFTTFKGNFIACPLKSLRGRLNGCFGY